jgi:hypothetical protein
MRTRQSFGGFGIARSLTRRAEDAGFLVVGLRLVGFFAGMVAKGEKSNVWFLIGLP